MNVISYKPFILYVTSKTNLNIHPLSEESGVRGWASMWVVRCVSIYVWIKFKLKCQLHNRSKIR